MKKPNQDSSEMLLQKDAELLKNKPIYAGSQFSEEDAQKLIHDLQIKQETLEHHNSSLMQALLEIQDALRESQEKYSNIFANAQEGFFQTSVDGSYISVNPALAKMYGFESCEELINSRSDIAKDAYFNPHERSNFLRLMDEHGFVKGYEYEVKRKNGQSIWFYEDAKAIKDAQGNIMYFEGFVVDITDRIVAENALKDKTSLLTNLIINLQEGILLEDSNRKIALTNQLFCNMFGISAPPEALLGADCTDSAEQSKIFFKNPEKFIAQIEFILANKKAVFNNELEMVDGRFLERDYIPTYVDHKYTGHLWKYRDITLRKQSEVALGASELKYRNLVENINDVVYKVDNDGTIKYISPRIEKIIGYTADEITGKNFSHFVGENANELSERLRVLKDNTELEKEYKIITKFGVPCYVRLSTKAVFENGIFIGGSGTLIDISDRKRAEERLRKLSQAVEQSPVMTLITDLKGEIEFVNAKLIELTGFTKEELIGKNPRLFSSSELGKESYNELWQTISSGSVWKGELHNIKKNGDFYWVMAAISPIIDAKGKTTHYLAVEEDITDRKLAAEKIIQQNERLNAIISAIPDMIFVIDLDGIYTEFYCSESLLLLFPDIRIIGKSLQDIFDTELANSHLQNIRECIQQKKLITYEYEMNIDDSVRFFEARMTPLGVTKALTFVRDITERKKAENEIQDLNVNLEIKIVERTSELAITNANLYSEIEARNKVALALEEALGRLHKIADQIPGSVFQFQLFADGTSCFPYASKGLWDVLRVHPEEVVNDASIVFSRIHPDQLEDVFASIQKSAKDMQLWNYEFQVVFDDGTVKWLYGRFSLQLEADGSVLWHGFITDITELKQAVEALRQSEIKHTSMISNISDVIGMMGADGFMKYKSPNIVKDFGWQPEDLVGTDGWLTVHPDDIERIQKEFYAVLQSDNTAKKVEYRYLCKDGSYRPIELTAINLLNDKVINGILLNYHDITERKQAEEKINEARNIAVKANLAKSEFLSRMSHELRTPMNSILGFGQLLDMGSLLPVQKKSVSHILQSGKHLLNLIDEVLDVSRIEAGHISIFLEPVNVIVVILDMIDSVRQQANERQLVIQLINSPKDQIYIKSDLKRLKQVLLNLLSNAIKYNRTGGSIIIKAERMSANAEGIVNLRITVTDTGQGIAAEDIAKLFVPFERIGAEKTETVGSGLGLAVTKKLMDAMDGNVGVTSVTGEGSSFWVEFPMAESKKTIEDNKTEKLESELIIANKEIAFQNEEKAKRAAELIIAKKELEYQNEEKSNRASELIILQRELSVLIDEKLERAEALGIADSTSIIQNESGLKGDVSVIEKTGTILYVEDNLPNVELVKEILQTLRPAIHLITTMYGKDAVMLASVNKPDIILLDLDLPDIHGSNVMTMLSAEEETKSIPVIIVSADAMPEQMNQLINSGAKKFLTKPFDMKMFLQVVDDVIGGK